MFSAQLRPPRKTTVFAAPIRSTVGERSSQAAAAAILCGVVTDKPRNPRAPAAASAAAAPPAGTRNSP